MVKTTKGTIVTQQKSHTTVEYYPQSSLHRLGASVSTAQRSRRGIIIMAEEEHETLEPPIRRSMDDPGAHDLGTFIHVFM
jgi:hypothetical protein